MTLNNKLIKSTLLTIIQYSILIYLMITLIWFSSNIWLIIIQFTGFIIALWAIIEMNKGKINIAPSIRKEAILITSGPYKYIRHPMYLSLILIITPSIITYYTSWLLIIYIIFIINLILKLLFEESLLKTHFTSYKEYMEKSWRLFPYIF